MNHDGECINNEAVGQGQQAYTALFVNGHPKGSVMVRMAAIEKEQETMNETLQRIEKGIDDLPKKLLTWLLILSTFIAIVEFLGPSLRKTLNISEEHTEQIGLDARNPPPTYTEHSTRK